jgi:hypothetical protein
MFQNDYAVNVCGKNMQLPIGHDIIFDHFYAYSTGYTPGNNQEPMWSYNAGMIAGPGSGMYNNVIRNCFSYGVRPPDGEFDPKSSGPQIASYSLASGTGITYTNNTSWSASSTSAAALFAQWQSQLGQTGKYVGVKLASSPVPTIKSLVLSHSLIVGGKTDDALVQFSAPLSSSSPVTISTNSPYISAQPEVWVYAGKAFNSFPIRTAAVKTPTVVTITVSCHGLSVSHNLTITP